MKWAFIMKHNVLKWAFIMKHNLLSQHLKNPQDAEFERFPNWC